MNRCVRIYAASGLPPSRRSGALAPAKADASKSAPGADMTPVNQDARAGARNFRFPIIDV